jgi:hypothetical protein
MLSAHESPVKRRSSQLYPIRLGVSSAARIDRTIVATQNVGHLARYRDARLWAAIAQGPSLRRGVEKHRLRADPFGWARAIASISDADDNRGDRTTGRQRATGIICRKSERPR